MILAAVCMLLSCSRFEDKELVTDTTEADYSESWMDLLSQINPGSNIILVEKNGSIQDAVNAAQPGDVIYIEPGIYRESLDINKPGISLIGLNGENSEKVVLQNPGQELKGITCSTAERDLQVYNLQFAGFDEPGTSVLSLSGSRLKSSNCCLNMTREDLGQGIAHYQFDLNLGKGEYSMVRLHRVVKENRPYRPIRTRGNIFMVHAAIQDFDDIYFRAGAEEINARTSSPFFLASRGIDVWGIDLAWTQVPIETEDFTFMKDWGLDRDADNTLAGMAVARLIRAMTCQGFGRLNLEGYCCTVNLIYYAAEKETRIHPVLRDIKGLVAAEGCLKYDPGLENYEELCGYAQLFADQFNNMIDEGVYNYSEGLGLLYMANLALYSPEEDSPVIPGLTNLQAIILVGCSPAENDIPCWHYFGGSLEEGFFYSDVNRFINLGINLNPHMPLKHLVDGMATQADNEDVIFDDYLKDIRVPVLYLGVEGGVGSYGIYTASLTSSPDITNLVVTKGVERCLDFGHADLWMGYDADFLIWEPLCEWLLRH